MIMRRRSRRSRSDDPSRSGRRGADERGIEPHGRAGDPGFAAPERGDFRLIPGALAANSGCAVTEDSEQDLVCAETTGSQAFAGAVGPDSQLYAGPASARFRPPE